MNTSNLGTPDYGLDRVKSEMTPAQRDCYVALCEIEQSLSLLASRLTQINARPATIRIVQAKAEDYQRYMHRMYWKICRQIAAKAKKQEGA
jgi:hypothetical protein